MKENHFPHRISKDLVHWMPLVAFEGETYVINSLEQVPEAVDWLNQQTIVGVDTETRPSFRRGQHYPVALVQIATEERCYLFQLNQIGLPQELLAGLQHRRPFTPGNCIDVQKMVGEYGILDLGLQKIFAIIFGKKISKSQQLTNWENLVLTPEQARYASTDAWATLLIYNELIQTKKLPKAEAEQLRQNDLKKQHEHQMAVLAARQAAAEAAKEDQKKGEAEHELA